MKVRYDLSRQPCNFNFLEFLVAFVTRGATEVCLDDSRGFVLKYGRQDSELRLHNIVLPACALAGVPVKFGTEGVGGDYHISAVLAAYREVGHIKKLQSVRPPKNVRYTVTLRDYGGLQPARNSNIEAWERFASDIGALVIPDFYTKPIGLHERMALYAGAEMNFHVGNGPAALCYFSDAPFLGFWHHVSKNYHRDHGFPHGSQLPWLNDRQKFVWVDDTYENIKREWEVFNESESAQDSGQALGQLCAG